MKRSLLVLLLGGFFYSCLFACMLNCGHTVFVKASELNGDMNGSLPFYEESESDNESVLHDSIRYISEVEDEDISYSDIEEDDSINQENTSYNEVDSMNMTEFQIMVIFMITMI